MIFTILFVFGCVTPFSTWYSSRESRVCLVHFLLPPRSHPMTLCCKRRDTLIFMWCWEPFIWLGLIPTSNSSISVVSPGTPTVGKGTVASATIVRLDLWLLFVVGYWLVLSIPFRPSDHLCTCGWRNDACGRQDTFCLGGVAILWVAFGLWPLGPL